MWGRQSYRWSNNDFEANAKDGIGTDWPIRYKEIAPWYDYVETFAGISGSKEGLDVLPDGKFMPPMDLTCLEKDVAARIKEHFKGQRHLIIGRTANITKPLPGRTNCQFRNKCSLGCPFGGYFSTQSSTLPAAMKTGNLTLRPFSIVTKVLYDKDTQRATGVEVLDAETNKTYEYKAKIVSVYEFADLPAKFKWQYPAVFEYSTTTRLITPVSATEEVEILCPEKISPAIIHELKKKLAAVGFDVNTNSSVFSNTEEAELKKFQSENELPIGNFNMPTLDFLGIAH